ncbi:hypothetical protein [Streptomyces sp. NPDC002962]|uniref:hypothetical protein n=1 Tax=Streptomyces sp. NPDC002962 TaxID=3364674 RepID=UPI00369A01D1
MILTADHDPFEGSEALPADRRAALLDVLTGHRLETLVALLWRVSPSPYAVRVSALAAKVLDAVPEHAVDTVWDILAAAAADPWEFRQFDDDYEGEDVRYAAGGQLSVTFWINRPLRSLTVLNIVWLR